MKSIFVLLIVLFFGLQGQAQRTLSDVLSVYNTRSVPYISVEELRMLQTNAEVIVLDARERKEYEVSRIPDAIYVGYSEFSSEEMVNLIKDNSAKIVVYCSLGVRSEEIGEKLQSAGYSDVTNLYGGIFEWKNKGYPVYDANGTETEKVHACSKLWGRWLLKGEHVYE